ncbi:crossover junction endodeoxyribonuclease RuvC [Kocuria varians]|uniref:Crossover junction endodeoxyribonuclease RuvC n=1 Tax=Kocuria varians TaxID=1272 RepID=A0A4Y4D012_KOCVA|nr:crossover junction endodeoxyribonuclease RuvC [Kocuria varians]GEC98528.1 crossover junction endodeoxyribonuclease RuvC [Kocuria varians]
MTATEDRGGRRVLAVDPGLTRCGFAVVDMSPQRTGSFVHVQVSGTKAHEALERRVLTIMETAEELIERFRPDVVAVERVFAQNNAPTVVGTAQATGVVIAAAARRGIPVAWHTPSEVKAAVTGDGSADKESVNRMVVRILRLDAPPRPADAADALALAVCHGWRGGVAGVNAAEQTSTHSGSRPARPGASATLTPAQQAWRQAETASRSSAPGRGRSGGRSRLVQ